MLWNDTMVESNEYYPYGGLFSAAASAQPYKYGSKELDRTHGLDLYDSEARCERLSKYIIKYFK